MAAILRDAIPRIGVSLWIAFQPTRMAPENTAGDNSQPRCGSLQPAGLDWSASISAGRQNQQLTGLVAARVADEGPFPGCAGRGPKHAIANVVVVLRTSCAPALSRGQTSERRISYECADFAFGLRMPPPMTPSNRRPMACFHQSSLMNTDAARSAAPTNKSATTSHTAPEDHF
jgi:hypothetical protein